VDVKDHAAGMVSNGGVSMGGVVFEQLGDSLLSGCSLGTLDSAERDEQVGVDGACAVELR
jgi:hypothetical protein